MIYNVLKDFDDADHKVRNEDGEKVPLSKKVGDTFIPAESNYPDDLTASLVASGTLELIVPEVIGGEDEDAPHRKRRKKAE